MKNMNDTFRIAVVASLLIGASGFVSAKEIEQETGGSDSLNAAMSDAGSLTRGQAGITPRPMPPYPRPEPVSDAFAGLSECRTVDAAFQRRPTLVEALGFLDPCLHAVRRKYLGYSSAQFHVSIQAVESIIGPLELPGGVSGIAIRVQGSIPAGSRLLQDLQFGVAIVRGGELFSYPARVEHGDIPRPARSPLSEESSLQVVIDGCPQLHFGSAWITTAKEFVGAYGWCLQNERSLQITKLIPIQDPEQRLVLVFSNADPQTIQAMNGNVEVRSGDMLISFRIEAYRPERRYLPGQGEMTTP